MAGLTLHLATLDKESFRNQDAIIGVAFPDIAKKAYKANGTAQEVFQYVQYLASGVDIKCMISEEDLAKYSGNSHFTGDTKVTDTPSLIEFTNSSFVDLEKPFWKAAATHLIGDLLFYHPSSKCIYHAKFQRDLSLAKEIGEEAVAAVWQQWYRGYDCINARVVNELKQVDGIDIMSHITPEMEKVFKVKFIDEEPVYQNWEGIRNWIYQVRKISTQLQSKEDIKCLIESLTGPTIEDEER